MGLEWDDRPEARAVVHLAQVRQFVRHDVVDHWREMNQPPVEVNAAAQAATSPARSRRRQRQPWQRHAEQRRVVSEALGEQLAGLFAQRFLEHPCRFCRRAGRG
jgi:hypothetical protein